MAKQKRKFSILKDKKSARNLLLISVFILFAKLILIFSLRDGAWLGADGESYLKGTDALIKDGWLSKDSVLTYWPAGYPIVIRALAYLSLSDAPRLLSIFQSLVYFAAVAFFVEVLRQSKLKKLAIPAALILGLNPTLALSSLVVGYESLSASCMLASVALIYRYQINSAHKSLLGTVIWVALIQSFSGFMQPRNLLIGLIIFLVWGLFQASRKKLFLILVVGTLVMLSLPFGLIFRNMSANGSAVLSKNLSVNMTIGAGDSATGGYSDSGGLRCAPTPPAATASDAQTIKCVLIWYAKHPTKSLKLFFNKTIYYWSPWSGPLRNGTMARNPWLKIDPIAKIESSASGRSVVEGWVGKTISYIWLFGGLAFLVWGFLWVRRSDGLERQLAALAGVPVVVGWLISLAFFGDHRFRLPSMGLSLFFQLAGYQALKERFFRPSTPSTLVAKPRTR